jgi:hypothetical protein
MVKRKSTVAMAAMAGLVAGAGLIGCQHKNTAPETSGRETQQPAGVQATDNSSNAATAGKHDCKGMNDCKGKGGCKTGDNGCAGKNSCKGKGGCSTNMAK